MEEQKRLVAIWLWDSAMGSAGDITAMLECGKSASAVTLSENADAVSMDAVSIEKALEAWHRAWCAGHTRIDFNEMVEAGRVIESQYNERGVSILVQGYAGYPERVAESYASARIPVISVYGDRSLLLQKQVAIVGSRETTESGRKMCQLVANAVIDRGLVVTSGGALGIDAIAHRAAMQANQPTVVVTATDVTAVYPKDNADIFEYARKFGAIVSQFPRATMPRRQLFPSRNILMAALSEATCVVQCREKSGALYTASASVQMKRLVLAGAVEGGNALHEGGLKLVKSGVAKLVSEPSDFDVLGAVQGDAPAANQPGTQLELDAFCAIASKRRASINACTPGQLARPQGARQMSKALALDGYSPFIKQIYAAMSGDRLIGRDEIARTIGCSDLANMTQALLEMEFDGLIECVAGRYRQS